MDLRTDIFSSQVQCERLKSLGTLCMGPVKLDAMLSVVPFLNHQNRQTEDREESNTPEVL